ncbi:SDR family NAD(P)-dependent oxidoreductase, partial [Trinickia sp.]|uniref:SDR family NAD(P)-dependent oxidoreductase n=1 Tax=Trinickia sp. TaxID=2571163 RepID=UPI003F7D2A5E
MARSHHHPKIVVVTGASAGVGRAAALAFAQLGADVALLARGAEALAEVAELARGYGVRALPIETDVSNADAVEA